MRSAPLSSIALGAALLLAAAAPGCSMPTIVWSQRVWLNGKSFVFSRVESLSEGPQGHRIAFQGGEFVITGPGPILVNGFEVSAEGGRVVLANQPIELKPDEEVRFSSDMTWSVRSAPGLQGPPAPRPAAPEMVPPEPPAGAAEAPPR